MNQDSKSLLSATESAEPLPDNVRSAFEGMTSQQWAAVQTYVLRRRSPQRPKLIDIRFGVDLVVTRFYIVLMVGKDRRDHNRRSTVSKLTKMSNLAAAVVLLVGANLVISAFIVLALYLIKSALGINLLPGHFAQYLEILAK